MDDDKYFVDTNFAMCLRYNAPIGSPYPQMYDPFNQDIFKYGAIDKSGSTLTEPGYTKFGIIQSSAAIFIGLTAAALVIFFVR
jgi:hypothetical protein